jgi:hypothetical protein
VTWKTPWYSVERIAGGELRLGVALAASVRLRLLRVVIRENAFRVRRG